MRYELTRRPFPVILFGMSEDPVATKPRWQFGAHTMWEAAPDVLRLDFVGVVDGDELKGLIETQLQWSKDKPRWFALADMSRLGGSTPSSREYMVKIPSNPNSVSISFGARFAIRILVDMMMRARRLLAPTASDSFIMVATEADAWAEVERCRNRR